jgi:hypothetical protein
MKNLIAVVLVFVSFNAFGQNDFDGKWKNNSDKYYVLNIDTNKNKVYEYSEVTKDTIYEKLIFKNNEKLTTQMFYKNILVDTYEYKIVNNNLQITSLKGKTTTTYKKQKL